MQITSNTSRYNDRRYGKPWIAKVTFTPSGESEFAFGSWVGRDSEEGRLIINANAGDIIAVGQKDNRNPKKSAPDFYQVAADGSLSPLADKVTAFDRFTAKPAEAVVAAKAADDMPHASPLTPDRQWVAFNAQAIDGDPAGWMAVVKQEHHQSDGIVRSWGATREIAEARALAIAKALTADAHQEIERMIGTGVVRG